MEFLTHVKQGIYKVNLKSLATCIGCIFLNVFDRMNFAISETKKLWLSISKQ